MIVRCSMFPSQQYFIYPLRSSQTFFFPSLLSASAWLVLISFELHHASWLFAFCATVRTDGENDEKKDRTAPPCQWGNGIMFVVLFHSTFPFIYSPTHHSVSLSLIFVLFCFVRVSVIFRHPRLFAYPPHLMLTTEIYYFRNNKYLLMYRNCSFVSESNKHKHDEQQ